MINNLFLRTSVVYEYNIRSVGIQTDGFPIAHFPRCLSRSVRDRKGGYMWLRAIFIF